MVGCENYGPLLGPSNNRCRIILRTPKGTIILITTHLKGIQGLYRDNGDLHLGYRGLCKVPTWQLPSCDCLSSPITRAKNV